MSTELLLCQGYIELACFFLGTFAQTAAHIPALRGHASAFPARVPQRPVNYGEISLLVVQLFLINVNIYTESRLLSRAALVACACSCVVPGAVAAKFHPCLGSIPACMGSIPACPRSIPAQPARVTLGRGTDTQSLRRCAVLSKGWVHIFSKMLFSHANTHSCPWESCSQWQPGGGFNAI